MGFIALWFIWPFLTKSIFSLTAVSSLNSPKMLMIFLVFYFVILFSSLVSAHCLSPGGFILASVSRVSHIPQVTVGCLLMLTMGNQEADGKF